jgi:hypothetical protein
MTDTRVNGTVREFTKEDWYGLAGCVCFKDNKQPLIRDLADGTSLVASEGLIGLLIYVEDDNLMGEMQEAMLEIPNLTQELAYIIMAGLPEDLTFESAEKFGFRR